MLLLAGTGPAAWQMLYSHLDLPKAGKGKSSSSLPLPLIPQRR